MRRLLDLALLCGVACVVTSSAYVLGQAQQGAPVPGTIVIRQLPQPKTKEGPPRAEVKKQAEAERKAMVQGKVVVRAAVMPLAKVRAAPGVQAAAFLDAQAAQYIQQFRPIFRMEYYFLRGTCDLTKDQRRQLAQLGERTVKTAARQFVDAQQKMMRGGWRPGAQPPDARKLIEQELIKSTAGFLTPEQQRRYKDEVEKRAVSRKQVVVDNMVAHLDKDLVLTSDQRGKLVEALLKNWDDSWGQSLDMLMNMQNFFPNVRDQVVVPILTEGQRDVWRRIPKNQGTFWGVSFGGMNMENDPLDDPELVEARKIAEVEAMKK
jgi:hypothetical protein